MTQNNKKILDISFVKHVNMLLISIGFKVHSDCVK